MKRSPVSIALAAMALFGGMLLMAPIMMGGTAFGHATPNFKGVEANVMRWRSLVSQVPTCGGVDTALVLAVIMQESQGNPTVVSSRGAVGLMQVEPTPGLKDEHEFEWVGKGKKRHKVFLPEEKVGQRVKSDLVEPYTNLYWGCSILSEDMSLTKGDLLKALSAYNAGAGAVKRYGGVPPYQQTQQYVVNVLGDYARFKQILNKYGLPYGGLFLWGASSPNQVQGDDL